VDWWIGLHIRVYLGAVKLWDWVSSVSAANSDMKGNETIARQAGIFDVRSFTETNFPSADGVGRAHFCIGTIGCKAHLKSVSFKVVNAVSGPYPACRCDSRCRGIWQGICYFWLELKRRSLQNRRKQQADKYGRK
jgi:hypothetical protein